MADRARKMVAMGKEGSSLRFLSRFRGKDFEDNIIIMLEARRFALMSEAKRRTA